MIRLNLECFSTNCQQNLTASQYQLTKLQVDIINIKSLQMYKKNHFQAITLYQLWKYIEYKFQRTSAKSFIL
ncbi:MAG TPA: hypothetical protein DCM02_09570 [Flavobacterium sp.]|nr:hypothetical protein [Flavobacterium sp.]HAT77011.1 hypothetical protein [Flavobacterium sp.]